MVSQTPSLTSNTHSQICDKCIKTYESDLFRLDKYLSATSEFYSNGSNNGTYIRENNNGDYSTSKFNSKDSQSRVHSENSFSFDKDVTSISKASNSTSKTIHQIDKNNKNELISDRKQSDFNRRRDVETEVSRIPRRNQPGQFRNGNSTKLSKFGIRQKVKKKFERPSYIPIPFSYDSNSSFFDNAGSDIKPVFRNKPDRNDVEDVSEKAFQKYTSPSKKLPRNLLYLISGSIISAFGILGCTVPFQGKIRTIKPYGVGYSVTALGKNTNSGYDKFGRKNDILIQKSTKHWIRQYFSNPTFYKLRNASVKAGNSVKTFFSFSDLTTQPTHIFYRLQIAPIQKLSNIFETKIRPVWCIPYSIVAIEYMYFAPLLEKVRFNSLQENSPVFPVGYTNKQLSQRICHPFSRKARRTLNRKVQSFDFSKFDSSIHPFFTSSIFTIWEYFLDLSKCKSKGYSDLRFYTCFTPFIYKNEIFVTRKGVCSGSYTTNFRDTVVNLSLIIMATKIMHGDSNLANSIINKFLMKLEHTMVDFREEVRKGQFPTSINFAHVYGDDGLVLAEDEFYIIHKFICEELEFTITYEDQLEPCQSFYFLGRFWDQDGLPWHTYSYKMAHIMFRSTWYKKEDLKFRISEDLDLFRVLSICLPLRDGKHFLYQYFYNWNRFQKFINGSKGYYLLKDWPHEDYMYVERSAAFNIMRY